MGTYMDHVEYAYIERLQEDIDIACQRLSEQGIESMVITTGHDSHRVSGSMRGKMFLENKYLYIVEFVQYCQEKMGGVKTEEETITLFGERGGSVELQKNDLYNSASANILSASSLTTTASIHASAASSQASPVNLKASAGSTQATSLNTEASDINETCKVYDDETDEFDDTQLLSPIVLKEVKPEGNKVNISVVMEKDTAKETLNQVLDTNQSQVIHKEEDMHFSEPEIPEKNPSIGLRRSNRRGKKDQSNNVGNKPKLKEVKVVLTKVKEKKIPDQGDQTKTERPGKTTVLSNDKVEPKDYSCGVCKAILHSLDDLNSHMASHKALACHVCKKVFKTKEKLDEHKQAHIDRDEYHQCKQCESVFKFIWQLGDHIEKVHEKRIDGKFPCTQCGHTFKRESHLLEHNERNPDCTGEQSEITLKENKGDILLSEISFIDPVQLVVKKKTVKQLLAHTNCPVTCEICAKTFDRSYNYKRHILQHSTVKPHRCVICSQQFQLEENLKKHMRLHDSRPYYCTVCLRRFETKTSLDHHNRFTCKKSTDKPDLTCKECGHQSSSVHAMERHTRTHTGIKQWTCDICGKLLSSKESITRHKAVFHQEERPYECETCGRTFKIKDTLKKHQKTHGEKKYKCELCGKACAESGNLKKHMMTHTKEKPYICETCGKAYGRRSLLDNHRRLHTGEKPYTCDVQGCEKSFRSYGNLKQHKATHTQEHSFICDICGRTFKVKSRLNHHRKDHTVDWRWPCDYCEQKYKSIFMYKNHLAKEHPEMKDDIFKRTNIILYECHICQKMYGDKEDLTRHIYIHKGLKPFKCQYCGKKFNDKSNMKCHEKIHTGEKKMNCQLCYKSFIQPRALRIHMKNVHGQGDSSIELKLEETIIVDGHEEVEYAEIECKSAVDNVIREDQQELTEMQPAQQAVVAQAYPVNPVTHSINLFPSLVRDFEPLMIVENYS